MKQPVEFQKFFDHTLLKPDATREEILKLCRDEMCIRDRPPLAVIQLIRGNSNIQQRTIDPVDLQLRQHLSLIHI